MSIFSQAFQEVTPITLFDLPCVRWPQLAAPLPRTTRAGRFDRAPRDFTLVVLAHSAALVEAPGLTLRRKARAADSQCRRPLERRRAEVGPLRTEDSLPAAGTVAAVKTS